MTSHNKWDHRFMEMAGVVASWSKDPSTKVGTIMVEPESKTILSTGYNGFPRGIKDDARKDDRDLKYYLTAHAEINAICNAAREGISLKDSVVYTTWMPCSGHSDGVFPSCAAALIQVGVKSIVIPSMKIPDRWQRSFDLSSQLFKEAGVDVWICTQKPSR